MGGNKIPERSEIPEAYTWDLRDLFESDEAWRAEYRALLEMPERIAAFAGAHIILDEGHITNIAVLEPYRGRGIGRKITQALLQYASNLGASYLTLEVRERNEKAQALYRSLGFIKVGVRKKYYEDTGEDGWIMVCDHLPPAEEDFTEEETVFISEE